MSAYREEWDLLKDGVLWKAVLAGFGQDPELEKTATNFVVRLQQSADRRDPLQFVLMDRRASNYLRQLMLLRFEASQRELAAASIKERTAC